MDKKWVMPGRTIIIEPTSCCGARCAMCPIEEFPYKNRHMKHEIFVKAIDDAYANGARYIDTCSIGDALLDPEIERKLSYVKTHYPDMKIYASCTGMTADPAFVSKYIDTLHVSFYGTTKEVYEEVHRGYSNYEKALSNVEEILEKPRNERPYMILTFLVLPQNQHQLSDWIKKWEPVADEIIVWKPHNWAGIDEAKGPSEDKLLEARSCGRPKEGAFNVWVNGDVTVCCFSWDKSMVIGNIEKQSFEEIYFGDKRKRIMEIHESKSFLNCGLPCEKCDQIFDRSDALVYTNHGRIVGQSIIDEDYVVRFEKE